MKAGAKTKVAIGILFGILLTFFLIRPLIRLGAALLVGSGTTIPEATRLVTEVEGLDRINKDAEAMFNRFGTSGFNFSKGVSQSALIDFPAISNLVSRFGYYSIVAVIPEGNMGVQPVPGFPAQIEIRFGSHTHFHLLHVVDWRKPFDAIAVTNREPRWSQIASNIFVE